jgi:hypothetical protein
VPNKYLKIRKLSVVIKNTLLKMVALSIIAPMMYANPLDPLNSLVASPILNDTVVVQGPLVIGIVNDIYGKAVKNKKVMVYVNKRKVGTTTTNKYGVWSYMLNSGQSLQDGAYIVQAYVQIAAGNNVWTQATLFNVQALRTPMPVRSGNVNAANSAINFPYEGAYINTSTPTIVGSLVDSNFNVVVGETVNISINGVNIATVTSDSNGVFSYQVSAALSDGSYTVGAHCVQTNVDLATNDFIVDTVAPAAPVIVYPAASDTVTSSTVIVTGTTEPNATITTFMDGDTFGDVCYADEYGNWSNEYDDLANGSHSVTAQASDVAQNTGPVSAATVFTVSA